MSDIKDPTTWRLSTTLGTKYRNLGTEGTFDPNGSNVSWSVIIQTSDLLDFLVEIFPAPIQIGSIYVPTYSIHQQLPFLVALNFKFSPFVDGKPIDPFSSDSSAPNGTYGTLTKVDIEYGPAPPISSDNQDITGYLEINGNATGEFINSPCPSASLTDVRDEQGNAIADEDNKDPSLTIPIVAPMIEWSVRWNQVPGEFFRTTLNARLRTLMGRVNSGVFPVIYDAPAETILLVGFTTQQRNNWNIGRGLPGYPDPIPLPNTNPIPYGSGAEQPLNLEMKFVEKNITVGGRVVGHNHFWVPGKGWSKVLIDGVRTAYESVDYNTLFSST